jgi:SAM-dependent methyltransferase
MGIMKKMTTTRDVILYLTKYISGNTLDFGAGTAKYRDLIKPLTGTYTTFDMMPGEHIDVVGDALNPPFKEAEFDTVISTQVLEHVEKPWIVVKQIGRLLRPEGLCIMTAPFLVPYHADPHDFFRYTRPGIESLFTNEGFSIVESGTYGNTPALLAEMFHFGHFSRYKKRSKTGAWLRDRIVNTLKKAASKIDPYFPNDAIYANTYVVARKK